MANDLVTQARALLAAATPGPWEWFGNTKQHEVYLATTDRGRVFVMDFARWGMQGGQPRFQVHWPEGGGRMVALADLDEKGPIFEASHRKQFRGIAHPDARLIAAAPTLLAALADRVEQLEQAAREVLAAENTIYNSGHDRRERQLAALAALRKVVG